MVSSNFYTDVRPERAAGGYSRDEGVIDFYTRVAMLLKPEFTVLDLGAGRGGRIIDAQKPDTPPHYRRLVQLKGQVRRVIGVDVDPIVLTNDGMDERYVIDPSGSLPLADSSIDLAYADWVIEHIENPKLFAGEIARVLKPGGWFCARTPNRFGVIAIAASAIPEKLHGTLLSRLQPGHNQIDKFPKFYRMNTISAITYAFPDESFVNASYMYSAEPAYHGGKEWLYRIFDAYERIMPSRMKNLVFVFVKKR
jgi:SAM-dependent methyltransferase